MGYFVPPRYLIRRIIVLAGCLLGIGLVSSWWLGAGLAVGSGDEIAAERGEPHLDDLGSSELTPAQAAALAVNELTPLAEGYHLEHPRYRATFNAAGLTFQPRPGGPRWQWRLEAIGAGEAVLPGVILDPVRPEQNQPWQVSYPRGGIIEEYWTRLGHIEQRFVIPEPLALHGADLTIAGIIQTAGEFEATAGGWLWRTGAGAVRLGQARVFDATGQDIPVTFRVTAGRTRLVVDGAALARATYPVIIDPPIGSQARISEVNDGASNSNRPKFGPFTPAVAYNGSNYLIVWSGDHNSNNSFGIYGQIIDANGGVIQEDFAIRAETAGSGKDKILPAVASDNNQYLVVWQENGDELSFADDEDLQDTNSTNATKRNEIFGQFVGANGALNPPAFAISNMADVVNTGDAFAPAVAYNSQTNQYLVVWSGDVTTTNKFLIFGQLVDATGPVGDDFLIAEMGVALNAVRDAVIPDVVYNSKSGDYFVIWSGGRADNADPDVPLIEMEIFGRVVKADGTLGGGAPNIGDGAAYRISAMGADGAFEFDAFVPAVTYNSQTDRYLVVWSGDETTDGNFAIYGATVTATTSGVTQPVSQIGISAPYTSTNPLVPVGYSSIDSGIPVPARPFNPVVDVAYNADSNQYLVTWSGSITSDVEIQWRLLDGNGTVIPPPADYAQISAMDQGSEPNAHTPALAYGAGGKYLAVWSGASSLDNNPEANDEYEIYGRFFTTTADIPSGPNLTLTKSANPPNPDLNDLITYMIVVNNIGSEPATGALIADPLPPNLVFQPGSINLTGTGTPGAAPPNLATGVTIPAGQSVTVTFQAQVTNPAAAGTTIMNTASVTSAEIASPATDSAAINVTPLPSLVLTKTAPAKAILGRVITYTVVVANDGPGAVSNVVLVDTLPPGVSLAGTPSLDPALLGTVVDTTIPTIQADIPTLAENQRITMTIPVSVSAGLTAGEYITNSASVTSVEVTIPITDEVSSLLTNPGLDLEKIASSTVVTPGQIITYTVAVTNTGSNTNDVVIVDTLPLSVTLAGTVQLAPALPGSNVDTTALPDIVATIPSFASNESVLLIIPVQTNNDLPVKTHLINTAVVTSLDVTDPVTDAVEVTIVDPNGPPAFEVLKAVSFADPTPGSSITYTIFINNNGGITANALISDTLPAGLTLAGPVSLDPPTLGVVTDNPPLLSIAVPVISSLQNITITFPVAVDPGLSAGTRLTNTVAITSEDALIPEVGAASITIREPALAITKTASLATANLGQTITYTYQVVNTGSAPLSNFMVNDDRLGAINLNTAILNPTEQAVGLATYTVAAGDFPGPLVNTVVVSATFAGTIVTATDSASVDVLPPFIYLPMIMKKENGPDLVGTFTLTPNKTNFAAGEPVQITAEVTNIGNQPADSFWVDLYINPGSTPDVNIPWNNTCTLNPCYGVAWFVESGLQPGQSLQLTSTPGSYSTGHTIWPGSFASGTTNLFLYVDSWNPTVNVGAVAETDESNNLFGYNPLSVTGVSLTDDTVAQPQPAITSTQTTTRPAVIK